MVHLLLSTTRCITFALIGRCLRRGVIILQRAVEILQRVVDWAVRLQRPAILCTYHYIARCPCRAVLRGKKNKTHCDGWLRQVNWTRSM